MDLFSTRIYVHQTCFEDFEIVQNEAHWLLKKVNEKGFSKHPGWERDTHSLSDPTFKENVLKKHRCYKIQNKISECVSEYLKQLGHTTNTVSGFDITSSWLTNTAPGEYARMHHHGTSDISGVYYVKSNVNASGNLYLQNHDPIKSSTRLTGQLSSQQDIPPAQGLLVLFPGWLLHGTRINEDTEERISLSFNIDLK
jgi:uncharacterized protein (TIGR02466 family)